MPDWFWFGWLSGAMCGWFWCGYKDVDHPAPLLVALWPIVAFFGCLIAPLWIPWRLGIWLRERERRHALAAYQRERELERLEQEVSELLR